MIVLMGVAGSGKSLQGQMLVKELGYQWISTGEIFRANLSEERQKELLTGKLLEDDEVIGLVDQVLKQLNSSEKTVLDGFPRTIIQAQWLVQQFQSGRFKLEAVFDLLASKDVVKQRLLARGRADDNKEVIKERFNEYETKTIPIVAFFRSNNIKVYDIDAAKPAEDVHADMMTCISKQGGAKVGY